MVISSLDVVALTIALTSSLALIVFMGINNVKLTESRNYWRTQYYKKGE